MNDPSARDKIDWGLTTWAGSRKEQLRRWSKLTLDEILQAQEEMADLAAEFAAAPLRKPNASVLREQAPTREHRSGEESTSKPN